MKKGVLAVLIGVIIIAIVIISTTITDKKSEVISFEQRGSLSWVEGDLPDEKDFERIDLDDCSEYESDSRECFIKEIKVQPTQINFNAVYPEMVFNITCECRS